MKIVRDASARNARFEHLGNAKKKNKRKRTLILMKFNAIPN